jgi:hypothetical protein
MSIRKLFLVSVMLAFPFVVQAAAPQWQDSTLVKMETGRGHTPLFHDVEVTSYSFKLTDGTVYIADVLARVIKNVDVVSDVAVFLKTKASVTVHRDIKRPITAKLHIVGKVAPAS